MKLTTFIVCMVFFLLLMPQLEAKSSSKVKQNHSKETSTTPSWFMYAYTSKKMSSDSDVHWFVSSKSNFEEAYADVGGFSIDEVGERLKCSKGWIASVDELTWSDVQRYAAGAACGLETAEKAIERAVAKCKEESDGYGCLTSDSVVVNWGYFDPKKIHEKGQYTVATSSCDVRYKTNQILSGWTDTNGKSGCDTELMKKFMGK